MLKRLLPVLFPFFLLLAGAAVFSPTASGEQTTAQVSSCSSDISLTNPVDGDILTKTYTLTVTVPSTASIIQVDYFVDGVLAGHGTQTSTTNWTLGLNTTSYPNGPHTIHSVIHLTDPVTYSTTSCATNYANIHIDNTAVAPTSTLEAKASITSWKGPTNYPLDIIVHAALLTDGNYQDVTTQASYEWKTINVGHISAVKNLGHFNSGPTPGDGKILIRVTYSGLYKDLAIPVSVTSSSTSSGSTTTQTSTSPTTTATTPTTTTAQQPAETTTSNQDEPARQTEANDPLGQCLAKTLNDPSYDTASDRQQRIGFKEFDRTNRCFATRKFVIPAHLAPIAPAEVKALPAAKKLSVKGIETISGNGRQAIRLSGTALPGKRVFIYLFSEPLVLSTVADNEGRWSYTLEDPMEPGEHEAYVTVEGDNDRPVRSGAFNFAVTTAPPSQNNPLGLSFQVQSADRTAMFMNVYVMVSGAIIIAALIAATIFFRRKYSRAADKRNSPTSEPDV